MSDATLYGQDFELALLLRCYERLEDREVIDVGAEQGSFLSAFLQAGCPRLFAFEPYPPHAAFLREHFGANCAVEICEMALGDEDGQAALRIAEDGQGQPYGYYHTLATLTDTGQVSWRRNIGVECRTIGSLVEQGRLPARVGVLKVDTEGHDLAVLSGLGGLFSAIVMAEYWDDVEALGACPYTVADLVEALRPRGYSSFVVVRRHDELQGVQVNSTRTRPGDWGNVLFFHETVFAALAPLVWESAGVAQEVMIDTALAFRTECELRQDVIRELSGAWYLRGLGLFRRAASRYGRRWWPRRRQPSRSGAS